MLIVPPIYIICQNIRSLHNVGAIFRSADAFSVSKMYLCGYTGHPPHHDIAKVALGAEKTVPWEAAWQTHHVIQKLHAQGVMVVSLEQTKTSMPLPVFCKNSLSTVPKTPQGIALVLGNEVAGVTKPILQRSDFVVHIPMHGAKESLNVSVAAGIALYAIRASW